MLRGLFFFFNDTATTEIYTLSLHDALPISQGVNGVYWYPISGQTVERQAEGRLPDARAHVHYEGGATEVRPLERGRPGTPIDRKSTRLNSSHANISYAVFCLKKKKHAYRIL